MQNVAAIKNAATTRKKDSVRSHFCCWRVGVSYLFNDADCDGCCCRSEIATSPIIQMKMEDKGIGGAKTLKYGKNRVGLFVASSCALKIAKENIGRDHFCETKVCSNYRTSSIVISPPSGSNQGCRERHREPDEVVWGICQTISPTHIFIKFHPVVSAATT